MNQDDMCPGKRRVSHEQGKHIYHIQFEDSELSGFEFSFVYFNSTGIFGIKITILSSTFMYDGNNLPYLRSGQVIQTERRNLATCTDADQALQIGNNYDCVFCCVKQCVLRILKYIYIAATNK